MTDTTDTLARALEIVNGPKDPDVPEDFPGWEKDWADELIAALRDLGYEVRPIADIRDIEREAAAQERERQIAVRKDWGSLPHGEFYEKYGNLAKDLYLLPTNCGCPDCRLWASGS